MVSAFNKTHKDLDDAIQVRLAHMNNANLIKFVLIISIKLDSSHAHWGLDLGKNTQWVIRAGMIRCIIVTLLLSSRMMLAYWWLGAQ